MPPFRYDDVEVFDAFEKVSDPGIYVPLPDDWEVGVADVVRSSDALRAGRYKAVNMAGAAVVAGVRNVLGGASFPFAFGGDGALLAVPPEAGAAMCTAMAATANFARDELGLELRVGSLTVSAIRAAGHDLRVARYAASPQAVFAMFSGGGAAYAEAELKAGRIGVPPVSKAAKPDLSGLSCRWSPIEARHGLILSLLAAPAEGASAASFRDVASAIIEVTQRGERGGHPVPESGPKFAINPRAMRMEAAATRGTGGKVTRFAKILSEMLIGMVFDQTGRSIGSFDPRGYRRWVTRNSDFRKYDDALRMTIDCSPAVADELDRLLAKAEAERIVNYGLHRQDSALMTCIVPSYVSDDHVHFLDGAGGGYALAAQNLKERLAARPTPGLAA